MNAPKVSVIMPVYNGEPYLREAVESILNQTFTDFEFIVINDGSTDGTQSILLGYRDSRLRVEQQENRGLVASLNRGLGIAQGTYIARQDADDISYPTRLEQQVLYMEAHPEVALLGTAYHVIDERGCILEESNSPTDSSFLAEALQQHNCFAHGTVMVRRSSLDAIGGYRQELFPAEDYDLWLRIAERYSVANLSKALYAWRYTHGAISIQNTDRQLAHDFLARKLSLQRRETSEEQWATYSDLTSVRPETQRAWQRYLREAYLSYLAGARDEARSWLQKALVVPGFTPDAWEHWISAQMFSISTRRNEKIALAFSQWAYESVPTNCTDIQSQKPNVLGRWYIRMAFRAYRQQDYECVRYAISQGLRLDPSWLRNRGVLSIGVESLIGRRAANQMRRLAAIWRRDRTNSEFINAKTRSHEDFPK